MFENIYLCSVQTDDVMLLSEFNSRFPDEGSCLEYLKSLRDAQTKTCPKCGNHDFYWKKDKMCYECKKCNYRMSLTKGTVMEHSKFSIRQWFYVMHLMTSIKQSISATEVQRQLGVSEYRPVWEMMMKLRDIMGKREDKYQLENQIELDEGFFPTLLTKYDKNQPLKRGIGSQRETEVLVMVESRRLTLAEIAAMQEKDVKDGKKKSTKRYNTDKKVGYLKMKVLPDQKAATIDEITTHDVKRDAIITSDASTSHVNFQKEFGGHDSFVEKNVEEVVKQELPWVHRAIGDCRKSIEAIHKEIDSRFLQYYLNEFCYKFNRRCFGRKLFDRLVLAAISYSSDFKYRSFNKIEKS